MARINRDLSKVTKEQMERTGGWKAREPGEYLFLINNSDYKETKNGDGMCLHLELQCVERGHERFKMRDFLTLEHPNPVVVEIANATLKAIAIAVGHPKPDFVGDSRELHNKRFIAVIIKEQVEQYGDSEGFQNRIVGYKPAGAMKTAAPAPRERYEDEEPPSHDDADRMRDPAF